MSNQSKDRIDLEVPFREKDLAKSMGARFDWNAKVWYVPAGVNPIRFKRWMTHVDENDVSESENSETTSGIGLSDLMGRINMVIHHQFEDSVWVRADIVKLNSSGSHIYMGLEERNNNGEELAATSAMVWSHHASKILTKFKEGTGQELTANMTVLLLCKPQFHAIYGFKLVIEDIDPQYTLGRLEAKKKN